MGEDPIVSEVRQVREKLAKQFDFEVHTIFTDLRERQSQLGSRLVRREKRKKTEGGHDSVRDSTLLHPGR